LNFNTVDCGTITLTANCVGRARVYDEEDYICAWNPATSKCAAGEVKDNEYFEYERGYAYGHTTSGSTSTGSTSTGSTVTGSTSTGSTGLSQVGYNEEAADLAEEQREAQFDPEFEAEDRFYSSSTSTGTSSTATGSSTGTSTVSSSTGFISLEDQYEAQEEMYEECYQRPQSACVGECMYSNGRCLEIDLTPLHAALRKTHTATNYVKCHEQTSIATCNGFAYGVLAGGVCGWHPVANMCVQVEFEYEGEYEGPSYSANGFELDSCYGRTRDTCVGECYWTGDACGEYDVAPLRKTHETAESSWMTLTACAVMGVLFGLLISVFIMRQCNKRTSLDSVLLEERV